MPLQPDDMLGPYRISGLLGEGGMGAVYRARDTRLHRDVAIKVLTAITLNDQERLQRFEQEARATGMLNHPNLLTIFDVGNHEGTPFLVGELLEGETLSTRLLRGAMPPRKAIECASQMAQGLAAAHEKGVVHRDLKPDNIFITREGRVKILDFGIAKLNPKGGADGPTFQMTATEPGMVLGTVGYMSPEQVRGEAVDERSDIFSFGTIVYEILSGERAFKRNSSIETLSAILKEEPPDLADRLPNIPPSLERLVRRCLEKDRERRFQSARDLAFNLETMSSMSIPATLAGGAPQQNVSGVSPTVRTSTPTAHKPLTSTLSMPATKAHPTTARPRTSFTKPKPRVSPLLLALLFVVAIAGAAFGGWWYATHANEEQPEAVFRRITFRRGEVRGARFTPDGDTIVYSAAWEGQPSAIFVASRQSPEARPLGINDADVEAVSKSTELAIMLRRDRLTGIGTLARVPLAGGMPREIADSVIRADWMPNGTDLAIVRYTNGKYRVEAPIGNLQYDTGHAITAMRVGPDGRIAFIEQVNGKDMLSLIANKKLDSIAAGWSHGTSGMVWHPNGKEIWLTGTDSAAPPSLYSVTLDGGNVRLVHRLTGSMRLYDVSSAGRFLLTNGTWRAALQYQAPGESTEHDVSWLDWSIAADLSPDGRTILFNETREGGGDRNGIYLRRADAPAPVRIGDGQGDGLSPDGRWVLCHNGAKLVLLPTGTGEARELKVTGPFDHGAAWMPDSRRVVIGGNVDGNGYQLHLVDTLDETSKQITTESVWGDAARPFAVSPDGRSVAGMTAQQTMAIYSIDGSAPPVPIATAEKGEVPITFSTDGTMLYIYRPTSVPGQITRITLATGLREPWKQFAPTDPGGVYKISPVFITPDATAYVYDALRTTSDLYVVEGLH
jgi:serine/threonine protein kinase/Tol biopolymer transport system component